MFKGMSVKEFNKSFKNDDDCRQYLFRLKWADGYHCKKCGNKKYHKGKSKYHFRCTQCLYGESPTANTIFHKMKVPLLKAFGMIFRISVKKKGISTLELSREFSVNKKTAWLFKRKIQEVMCSSGSIQLKNPVDSASFIFGGAELEWKSKFQGEESTATLLVEIHKNKLGSARGWVAGDNHSAGNNDNSKAVNNDDFKTEASNATTIIISTEQTTPDKKQHDSFNVSKSSGRSGVQILIFNLKNWLRGIHHHCSARFSNGYLQEFIFRFNRRNNLRMILHQTIAAGIFHEPYFYKPIKPSLGNRPAEKKPLFGTLKPS